MHPLVYLMLLAGTCLAHYRSFERNLVERDEPREMDSDLVECPVCEGSSSWLPNKESCKIVIGNKRYKRCTLGVYINEVCGNRPDCYRGPGEQCTEKMEFDIYGQRCARGYYCNKAIGKCTGGTAGLSYAVDSNEQYIINPNLRYPLRARREA